MHGKGADGPGGGLVILQPGHLGNARQTEEFGAAALHIAQVIGVIDHARKVGVFVIDADGQDMGLAVEMAQTLQLCHAAARRWRRKVSTGFPLYWASWAGR